MLALLALWQRSAYVDYSDGVYALSSRLVLHGSAPYQQFAAAQPPGVFYVGAALLALGDSVDALRRSLAVVDLVLAATVLVAVWRLTERRLAAALAGIAMLITPWALREHTQLLPETFAAPLLVGAMLAAARRRTAWVGGVLGALAVMFKVAFVVPAITIAIAAASPVIAAVGLTATLALGALVSGITFGGPFWTEAFRAQAETGLHSLHYVGGLWVQAAWNLLPLAVPAVIAVYRRRRALDGAQFRTVLAGALGSLVLLVTLLKQGSYLNVLVVIEPPAVILAACGWTWLLTGKAVRRRGGPLLLAGLSLLLGLIEIGSMLGSPEDPTLFGRPFAASAPSWALSSTQVDAQIAPAKRCPISDAYSGPPYLAFAAGRRMPGSQPDQFIIEHAHANARFLAAATRDMSRCP